jgi:AmmeMemoRadiSam system protein B
MKSVFIKSCRTLFLCVLLAPHSWARSYHYSSSSDDPAPYLRVIRKSNLAPAPPLPAGESIRAGIVTHHFLASGLMVRFFAELRAQSSPETIVLVGPNHFHHGLANISLSSLPWKTPFGLLQTDAAIERRLRQALSLPEDPEAFTGEHSVGVLVPFLKYYFPKSRIVPVLIDVNAQSFRLKKLRKALAELLSNPKVLVLLSMDFSHDSNSVIADSRDEQAQQTITAMNVSGVNNLHVDCRRGLWLLLASVGDTGPVKVEIKEHTNSSRLIGNPTQPDVTSYFTVLFVARKPSTPHSAGEARRKS